MNCWLGDRSNFVEIRVKRADVQNGTKNWRRKFSQATPLEELIIILSRLIQTNFHQSEQICASQKTERKKNRFVQESPWQVKKLLAE